MPPLPPQMDFGGEALSFVTLFGVCVILWIVTGFVGEFALWIGELFGCCTEPASPRLANEAARVRDGWQKFDVTPPPSPPPSQPPPSPPPPDSGRCSWVPLASGAPCGFEGGFVDARYVPA